MSYFSTALLNFLSDLEANNNRDWFHANKKRYETEVKKPFEAFIAAVIQQLQAIDPTILITPKDAIFRIYRDTRFSKDKTPYKTQVTAAVSPGGRKDFTSPGIYIHIEAAHVRFYSGVYKPDSKQLQLIREAIVTQPKRFEDLINDKKFKQAFGHIRGEQNKRIPAEFRAANETQGLIANKQFYYFAEYDPALVLDAKLVKKVVEHYQIARPLGQFFSAAMKGEG